MCLKALLKVHIFEREIFPHFPVYNREPLWLIIILEDLKKFLLICFHQRYFSNMYQICTINTPYGYTILRGMFPGG